MPIKFGRPQERILEESEARMFASYYHASYQQMCQVNQPVYQFPHDDMDSVSIMSFYLLYFFVSRNPLRDIF